MLKLVSINAVMIIIEKLYYTAYPNDASTVEVLKASWNTKMVCIPFVIVALMKGKSTNEELGRRPTKLFKAFVRS